MVFDSSTAGITVAMMMLWLSKYDGRINHII